MCLVGSGGYQHVQCVVLDLGVSNAVYAHSAGGYQ